MTNENLELTRRKILASAGAIGVAGAGAGLGTSAYFSDEENFANNRLVAGELDLKVDWEEHYSYPQIYDTEETEFEDPTTGLDVVRDPENRESEETYVRLPDPEDPVVWVSDTDLDTYMDNTAIEAFPDSTNDRIQDTLSDYDACTDFADLDEDLDPSESLRTDNADTRLEDGSPAPLINLTDVKPGDFGELTLSFHLCDNPGYVWLRAANIIERENEHFGNDGAFANNGDTGGELGEKARALVWYDSGEDGWNGDGDEGDNVYQQSKEQVIKRGTLREVLKTLASGEGIPLEGDLPAADGGGTGRNCFDNSTTYQIGFAWWLPEDVGNEVAADSIHFDLGFYTEQCRHNNGVSLSSGLTGYWPLDSVGDGTAEDLSGRGNDGTVNGVSSVDGKVAGAGSFDGRNHIKTPSISIDGSLTVAAWVKRNSNSNYQAVSTQGNNGDNTRNWWLGGQKGADEVHWSLYDQNGNNIKLNSEPDSLPQDTFTHICGVYDQDAGELRVYIDGQLDSTGVVASFIPATSDNPGGIGAEIAGDTPTDPFDGIIDEVRIYNRALSDQEIENLADL